MNILVVGGAGYVGGGIVDNLKDNHHVTVYDSLIYEESFRKDVDFVYGDVRDHDKLKKLLDKNDAVIWLAALVKVKNLTNKTCDILSPSRSNPEDRESNSTYVKAE